MAIEMGYEPDGRLRIEGLACACSLPHALPTQEIYVGKGLIPQLPKYIARQELGTNCVLVCDDNTWEVAGRTVLETLRSSGISVTLCCIERTGEMAPDETAAGELLLHMHDDTQFLVSVGSGSLTDITRVVATRTKLPFVAVATAPSMDGYTSVVAPLLLRGVKIHRHGVCPDIIVCDLDILASAPLPMVISGVGDVVGKYIAIADWQIGQIINGEPYCPTCGEIVLKAAQKLMEGIDEIRAKSDAGMRVLIEALLLSGLACLIIGNTRPVASVEHNIAHFLDMRMLERHGHAPSHGATVGVATLMVWPMFERFAKETLESTDVDALQPISPEERRAWMQQAYGLRAAETIMEENPQDFLTREELHRRVHTAIEKREEIREILLSLPSYESVKDAMQRLGAPMTMQELGVDEDLTNLSMHAAKDYRTRYTLMKTLDEFGMLQAYLVEYPMD